MKHISVVMKNGDKHDYPYLHFIFGDGKEIDIHDAETIISKTCKLIWMVTNEPEPDFEIFCVHCHTIMDHDVFERKLLEWHNG